jgi:hypothetical protein
MRHLVQNDFLELAARLQIREIGRVEFHDALERQEGTATQTGRTRLTQDAAGTTSSIRPMSGTSPMMICSHRSSAAWKAAICVGVRPGARLS